MGLKFWLLVAAGGAVGAGLRTALSLGLPWSAADGWPLATMLVNLVGCLLIGICWTVLGESAPEWRGLVIAGLLGALTTFSTWGLDAIRLAEAGRMGAAAAYVGISTGAGLVLVVVGLRLGALLR